MPRNRSTTDIPSLSPTEALILELLLDAGRPLYGLELVKSSDRRLKRGTVYVLLDRMEDKGFVESEREQLVDAEDGPVRRTYRATGVGQRVFAARELHKAAFAAVTQ